MKLQNCLYTNYLCRLLVIKLQILKSNLLVKCILGLLDKIFFHAKYHLDSILSAIQGFQWVFALKKFWKVVAQKITNQEGKKW